VADHVEDALVAELRALGDWLDVPEPADQRAAVRARLARLDHRRRRVRRWIVATVAAIVGTVAVVPPARAAVVDGVGDLLRVAGIEVRREPAPGGLPARPSPLPSVRPSTLDEARRVGRLGPRANLSFSVQFEELTTSPLDHLAAAVKSLTDSLNVAAQNGWVTPEEARHLWYRYHAQADESAPQPPLGSIPPAT